MDFLILQASSLAMHYLSSTHIKKKSKKRKQKTPKSVCPLVLSSL